MLFGGFACGMWPMSVVAFRNWMWLFWLMNLPSFIIDMAKSVLYPFVCLILFTPLLALVYNLCLSAHLSGFVQKISAELLNLLYQTWYGGTYIIMRWGLMPTNWDGFFKVKIKVIAYVIKRWLFPLCIQWTNDSFATKLSLMISHHKPKCSSHHKPKCPVKYWIAVLKVTANVLNFS